MDDRSSQQSIRPVLKKSFGRTGVPVEESIVAFFCFAAIDKTFCIEIFHVQEL